MSVAKAATISPGTPIPTGTTELIIDGGLPQAQVPLLGTDPATLSLNTDGLALGTHTVQVYYSGNTSLSAATSNTVPSVPFWIDRSEWQTPLAFSATLTSPGPGSRSRRSSEIASGSPTARSTAPRT